MARECVTWQAVGEATCRRLNGGKLTEMSAIEQVKVEPHRGARAMALQKIFHSEAQPARTTLQ